MAAGTAPGDPSRRRLLGATAALAPLGLAGCAGGLPWDRHVPAASVPAPTAPTVHVGDRWTYQLVNRYNRIPIDEATAEVAAVAPELRVRVALRQAGTVVEERYARPWVAIAEATFDLPITFETPMPLVPEPPMQSSASTATRYRAEGHGDLLAWYQSLVADRWERLQVPAGAFDCLRVTRSISFRHPDLFRHDPRRYDVLWYAPAVNRWVQREWTGDYGAGGPARFAARAREDWIVWQLTAYRPAG